MPTTIQVSDVTKQLLASLKNESGKSYDEILMELLEKHLGVPKSLAGRYPQLKQEKKSAQWCFKRKESVS